MMCAAAVGNVVKFQMEIFLKKSGKFETLSVILYPIFYNILVIKIHQDLFQRFSTSEGILSPALFNITSCKGWLGKSLLDHIWEKKV